MTELKTAASGTKDARKAKALRGVAIALLLCLVSMFLQNLIQTDFGRVEIQQIQTVGISGYKHTATLYIPENATPETPAPAVLMAHGSWKAREVMNSYAVELARRDMSFITMTSTAWAIPNPSISGASIPGTLWRLLPSCPM